MLTEARAHVTRRALAPVLVLVAGLTLVVACGSGVRQADAPASTTVVGTGGDTVLVPPTAGPRTVPAGEDPSGVLGDDPELNELAQACFGGDLFACDTLFTRTEVDSDLEAYSQTCGGRIEAQPGAPGCADRFDAPPPDPEPPGALGDDAALDALADDCFGGDLGACDDLYLQADVGSDYESYGSTCGGRLTLGSDGGCESQFGGGTSAGSG